MKPKELLEAGAVIAVVAGGMGIIGLSESGFFGGKPPATDESCMDVTEGDSRPVAGACLLDTFADLDALRKMCGGEITTVIKSCGCGGTEAPVWTCEGDE